MSAYAPGRVNLIGDHTDYAGGLVMPMAIDRGTTVRVDGREDAVVRLTSASEPDPAVVELDVQQPDRVEPGWGRFIAGVVAELRPAVGITGHVTSDLPSGAGLSSSSALTVATALALGFDGPPLDLALMCQRAEQRASGVMCGVMDQLTMAAAIEGCALLIDCGALEWEPVALPSDVSVVVVHSGERRTLVGSAYEQRRKELEAGHPSRVRHVETENARVRAFAGALRSGDNAEAGRLMSASHASLRDDYEVSTPILDALVNRLVAAPGVYGARLTGAGFGGCVVALTAPGAVTEGWVVRPSGPARTSHAVE